MFWRRYSHQIHKIFKLIDMNLMYEDNGIGIREGHSKGFGMHNIESRVQTLKGNMSLESNEMGTFYNFDIPFKPNA